MLPLLAEQRPIKLRGFLWHDRQVPCRREENLAEDVPFELTDAPLLCSVKRNGTATNFNKEQKKRTLKVVLRA